MIEPFPIATARDATQDTVANRLVKKINGQIEKDSKDHKHESCIEIFGMDSKIHQANKDKSWTFGLLGGKAEELLESEEREALDAFRKAGYLIRCCAYASYCSSTYEEGWNFQYVITIKW